MEIFNLPKNAKCLIFDIDSTLYTCPEYAHEQIDCQIRHFADLRGMTHEQARKMISDARKDYAASHDGKRISLGNLFTHFGITIEESIAWRTALVHPEEYLERDERLISVLADLQRRFSLICVTNNPVAPAVKTLEVLGIDHLIEKTIGLDTCKKSKPDREMLDLAAKTAGVAYNECISIGDRYDIDLALPLEMGMGGILVSGVEEIYELPGILGTSRQKISTSSNDPLLETLVAFLSA